MILNTSTVPRAQTSRAGGAKVSAAVKAADTGRLGRKKAGEPTHDVPSGGVSGGAEAGWSTLKTELLPHGGAFASLEEARLEVAYYLDTYFNLDRRHYALGYRSPHQFERDCLTNLS